MTTHKSSSPDRTRITRAFLTKVVVNAGVGRASQQPNFEEKILPQIIRDVSMIAGQKPQVRRAKKSIAGFKTREGQVVGVKVTIRGVRAVDFFERLITIVLPRVRDFGGIDPHAVDTDGALNIGFREQLVFPELHPEESTFLFSLGVNLVPKGRKRDAAIETYRTLGIPFKKTVTK